jgi:hypothetical protein
MPLRMSSPTNHCCSGLSRPASDLASSHICRPSGQISKRSKTPGRTHKAFINLAVSLDRLPPLAMWRVMQSGQTVRRYLTAAAWSLISGLAITPYRPVALPSVLPVAQCVADRSRLAVAQSHGPPYEVALWWGCISSMRRKALGAPYQSFLAPVGSAGYPPSLNRVRS